MTDEDAFHAALDANPADSTLRLIFADWLEERDDPRAAGYRAMGRVGINGCNSTGGDQEGCSWDPKDEVCWFLRGVGRTIKGEPVLGITSIELPSGWFECVQKDFPPEETYPLAQWTGDFPNRRAAEDAAALAFSRLSPEQQAAILQSVEQSC